MLRLSAIHADIAPGHARGAAIGGGVGFIVRGVC